MNILISLLYAPFIFFALKNFDIQLVALGIFIFSFIWLLLTLKQTIQNYIFPLIYILIALLAFLLNDVLLLKLLPMILSLLITFFILYSYWTKNSFIFIFLNKINKKVEADEKEYIQKSTLFWFFISLLNVIIHSYILYIQDIIYWTYYSSIGWYVLFIIAAVIQFGHKKIFFNRRTFA
jgi:hypothetical protein